MFDQCWRDGSQPGKLNTNAALWWPKAVLKKKKSSHHQIKQNRKSIIKYKFYCFQKSKCVSLQCLGLMHAMTLLQIWVVVSDWGV